MPVERRTKLCWSGEVLAPVPIVHLPPSVPTADPVLCKDTVPAMRPRLEGVGLDIKMGKGNRGRLKIEWLLGVVETFIEFQDLFRITNLVRAT